jgi:hypothetical protein
MGNERLWGEFVTASAFFVVGALLALRQDEFPWAGLVGIAVYFIVRYAVCRRRAGDTSPKERPSVQRPHDEPPVIAPVSRRRYMGSRPRG